VIAEALAMARVKPETVTYIEAHGTGTPLGDPIEVAALTQTFRATTEKTAFCAIGSVKTNIGHLDTAAGVAGLIKTVLALKHQKLPPSLHFEQPNPQIDFATSPFYVNTAQSTWQTDGSPRRAGVSSFGIGGTNAHVVLEEAPRAEPSGRSRPWQLLLLSATTGSALETATANLSEHFKQHPDLNLADAAYTLQRGRRVFNHRRMLVCRDLAEAVTALQTLEPSRVDTRCQNTQRRSVGFMFPGQGTQYVRMAWELYRVEPTFREQVDLCAELLQSHLGFDLRRVLYPQEEQVEAAIRQMQQTLAIQPALFVIEYALAKLWMTWGVYPQAMIGHSIGEYVAACLAGVFSLPDALALVAARARLMQQLPSGAMLAVPLPEQEIQGMLGPNLYLAAVNGPSLCVVSGPLEAVEQCAAELAARGVNGRYLRTSHAFHSAMMDPIVEQFTAQVARVCLHPPRLPYISNVTGTWMTEVDARDPRYWGRHLRQAVRFAQGITALLAAPELILLEVGPGQTLSTLARQHAHQVAAQTVLTSLRPRHEPDSDIAFLLTTLGRLWLNGVPIQWSRFYAHERRHRLPLPTYPFERQRYWIAPQQEPRLAVIVWEDWVGSPTWPTGSTSRLGNGPCRLLLINPVILPGGNRAGWCSPMPMASAPTSYSVCSTTLRMSSPCGLGSVLTG
jgi:acyl transferase domain-containing protein